MSKRDISRHSMCWEYGRLHWYSPEEIQRSAYSTSTLLPLLIYKNNILLQMWLWMTVNIILSYVTTVRAHWMYLWVRQHLMTSSNGNIFCVTGHLCREFTGEFPAQKPVMQSFDAFFHPCLNKRLSKQSWGWWFETSSHPLWRHCNES